MQQALLPGAGTGAGYQIQHLNQMHQMALLGADDSSGVPPVYQLARPAESEESSSAVPLGRRKAKRGRGAREAGGCTAESPRVEGGEGQGEAVCGPVALFQERVHHGSTGAPPCCHRPQSPSRLSHLPPSVALHCEKLPNPLHRHLVPLQQQQQPQQQQSIADNHWHQHHHQPQAQQQPHHNNHHPQHQQQHQQHQQQGFQTQSHTHLPLAQPLFPPASAQANPLSPPLEVRPGHTQQAALQEHQQRLQQHQFLFSRAAQDISERHTHQQQHQQQHAAQGAHPGCAAGVGAGSQPSHVAQGALMAAQGSAGAPATPAVCQGNAGGAYSPACGSGALTNPQQLPHHLEVRNGAPKEPLPSGVAMAHRHASLQSGIRAGVGSGTVPVGQEVAGGLGVGVRLGQTGQLPSVGPIPSVPQASAAAAAGAAVGVAGALGPTWLQAGGAPVGMRALDLMNLFQLHEAQRGSQHQLQHQHHQPQQHSTQQQQHNDHHFQPPHPQDRQLLQHQHSQGQQVLLQGCAPGAPWAGQDPTGTGGTLKRARLGGEGGLPSAGHGHGLGAPKGAPAAVSAEGSGEKSDIEEGGAGALDFASSPTMGGTPGGHPRVYPHNQQGPQGPSPLACGPLHLQLGSPQGYAHGAAPPGAQPQGAPPAHPGSLQRVPRVGSATLGGSAVVGGSTQGAGQSSGVVGAMGPGGHGGRAGGGHLGMTAGAGSGGDGFGAPGVSGGGLLTPGVVQPVLPFGSSPRPPFSAGGGGGRPRSAAEKRRRSGIRDKLEQLRMVLPDGSTRMTTEAVLSAALSYIQDLSSEVISLKAERDHRLPGLGNL